MGSKQQCLTCERLNREIQRLERAHRAGLRIANDHAEGDVQQYMLLMAKANEARIDLDIVQVELMQHQDRHAIPK